MSNINALSEEQQATIKTEGATQIEAVNKAGEENVAAVNDKGVEVLASIPEDYQTTYSMAEEGVRTKADAIVLSTEGDAIVLTDSAEDPLRGLKLYGKTEQISTNGYQLFDLDSVYKNSSAITILENGLQISGWASNLRPDCIRSLQPNTTYWAKCNMKMVNKFSDENYTKFSDTINLLLYRIESSELGGFTVLVCGGKLSATGDTVTSTYSFTTPSDMTDCTILAYTERYTNADGEAAYSTVEFTDIMIAESEELLENWEPYTGGKASPNPDYPQELMSVGDDGDINVHIRAKNIISQPYNNSDKISAGVQYKVNADGSICIQRVYNSSAYSVFYLSTNIALEDGVAYNLQTYPTNISGCILVISYTDENGNTLFANSTLVWNSSYTFKSLYIQVSPDCDINARIYPILEVSDVGVQSFLVSTSNGLLGIRTINKSLANYTDSSGNMWICDEIDFERGVYVQRIKELVLTGEESYNISGYSTSNHNAFYNERASVDMGTRTNQAALSTHFIQKVNAYNDDIVGIAAGLGNAAIYYFVPKTDFPDVATWKEFLVEQYAAGTPVKVKYILETPIEHELTATEIGAFKALKTNKPVTTILNDSGAWMGVSYNADLKTFITNYVNELLASQSE